MKPQKLKALFLLVSLVVILFGTQPNQAQQAEKLKVALNVNDQYEQFAGFEIKFDEPQTSAIRLGTAPGGVRVTTEKLSDPQFTYRIKVDSDGDGNLENEPAQAVLPDAAILVKVNRRYTDGRQQKLPYTIKYSRYLNKNNEPRESFLWIPHYRAEGKLKLKNCETLLVVLDLNGDGLFEQRDFAVGTSVGLDKDGDGRIWGKEEWLKGKQIVDYCGVTLLVDSVTTDGSALSFVETTLHVARIGEPLPAFSLTTDKGKTIDSTKLRDKLFLLDFWASWCSPCVGNFVYVKQLDKEFGAHLETISINVDAYSELPAARQAIEKYGLTWPQVMSGQGDDDPLWKMFGGMENNRLAIPLYVLVDQQGQLRYAGNGGEKLVELRANVQQLVQSRKSETSKQ
jgi:thiol-disulfide isomerase/thioredoxin